MSDLFTPTIARTSNQSTYSTNTQTTKTSSSDTDNNVGYLQDSSADNLTLTMEDFLQLMIVQFQNQDIDNPASTSDMMNQLISMSTIQAMATMTDAATMSYAASLVGKTVTVGEYTSASGLKEIVGEVTGTGTYNGEQVIFVNGKSYALSSIMAVGELPAEEETPAEGTGETDGTGGSDTPDSSEGGDKI
nr:flagellar hook capping FlgD N-terminal domain-containing protein [uncultured Agathobaculum sp.]